MVRTLSHSLDNERLHHAYLFTGTRGVGKTTIARILAKALNCEQGVSSKPCGQCNTCMEVDQGSFIDLIEVDAASKTKVEDTRALLDNVPYLPTAGRYKIYLFDEIHMLSGHSFNAFLKTLEEPPAHVKFLMATTDPQKLPITVLSRCIQFNLRAMDSEEIAAQLEKVLPHEEVEFEPAAVHAIARLAQGSMRDALSIVDQAIAYTQSKLTEMKVREMLGMLSQDFVTAILFAIAQRDAEQLLNIVEKMFERAININGALDDLLLKLHDLGLYKVAPKIVETQADNIEQLKELDAVLSAEEIQLFYQIGLIGKRDLENAPTPRVGLQMILLRMIAFHPASQAEIAVREQATTQPRSVAPENAPTATVTTTQPPAAAAQTGDIQTSADWLHFVRTSNQLKGMAKQFAQQVSFGARKGNTITLILSEQASPSIARDQNSTVVQKILTEYVGQPITLNIQRGTSDNVSFEKHSAREREGAVQREMAQIEQEEIPKMLRQEFDAAPDIKTLRLPTEQTD